MAKKPFKKRYVLGEGFPWALGSEKYYTMGLCIRRMGVSYLSLMWPKELWNKDLPKYRLVLERIHNGKKRKVKT